VQDVLVFPFPGLDFLACFFAGGGGSLRLAHPEIYQSLIDHCIFAKKKDWPNGQPFFFALFGAIDVALPVF
jgi:hypothetical protein